MTSATERLRALLDERGVEWMDDSPVPSMKPWKTSYVSFTGEEITLSCYDEPKWIMGTMVFHTPEQAVDATLGRGTCHAVFEVDAMSEDDRIGEFVCSECGGTFGDGRDQLPHYCPNCGRRCVG